MQKHSDEALVAYLDGELDADERAHVEAWLDADPAIRDRLLALAESAKMLHNAFADFVTEPVPERLIAAARGEIATATEAEIVVLRPPRPSAPPPSSRRWLVQLATAAGLFGLVVGGGVGYFGNSLLSPPRVAAERQLQVASMNSWLDNAAGDYKLMVNAGDALVDVPASGDNGDVIQKVSQSLPQPVRLPNLQPWELKGARLVVLEGRSAAQPRLHHRQQGDRAVDADHRLDQAARHRADLRTAAGSKPPLLAASGSCPGKSRGRPERDRLTCGASPTMSPGQLDAI